LLSSDKPVISNTPKNISHLTCSDFKNLMIDS
jgi:hypothetical protein